ncbi:hypothetical protein HMPREF3207_00610, partial [Citrobacter koseri]
FLYVMPDGGDTLSGLQDSHTVGPVSVAPPGLRNVAVFLYIMPDGGDALSGLQDSATL